MVRKLKDLKKVEQKFNVKNSIAVNSCTAAFAFSPSV